MTQQPNPPLGGDEAKVEPVEALLKRAVAAFNAMSPEDQAAHMEAQRKSWIAAEMAFGDEGTRVCSPAMPAAPVLPVERPFGLSPMEQERIRSGLIAGLEKAFWAGSEINTDFDALTEADAILSTIKGEA